MEPDNRQISEFNEAIFQLKRVNHHFEKLASYRDNGYVERMMPVLDSLEIEFTFDAEKLSDETDVDYVGKLKEINDKIFEAMKNKKRDLFYLHMLEKEKLLRKIQQISGKGGKYKDPYDDDFLE